MTERIQRKVSFWQLGLGLLLVVAPLTNFDTRSIPSNLVPTNSTQWFSYYASTCILILSGIVLIFFGLRGLWRRPPAR